MLREREAHHKIIVMRGSGLILLDFPRVHADTEQALWGMKLFTGAMDIDGEVPHLFTVASRLVANWRREKRTGGYAKYKH